MIKISNLCKSFGGRPVLYNLDLTIEKGETMAVIGRSGCGKSVLLKHIMGVIHPDAGSIAVSGEEITTMTPKQINQIRLKMGMLFQGAALFDSLTVWENVGFALLEHSKKDVDFIRQRGAECLNLVGLRGIEELYPSALSGGMRKRVGLARAICMNPEIILYDEPTTGLDPIMADGINNLIVDLQRKLSVTAIVVTHDMNSVYKVASRVAMLYQGRIIEVCTPQEIQRTQNPVVKQFIRGEAQGPISE